MNWSTKNIEKVLFVAAVFVASTFPASAEIPSLKPQVDAGILPAMADRIPEEPLFVDYESTGKEVGRYGGDLNLLMGKAKDIGQMTVYSYARVVGYNTRFELQPDIVKSFDVKEGRDFTFTLRKGHKWSDGYPLTSEDFRYFWEDMVKHPELGRKGVPSEMLVDGEEPTFEVIDARTFRYVWKQANPEFLTALAAASPLYIYRPAHYMKQFHEKYADVEKLNAMAAEDGAKDWASIHTRRQRQRRPENPDLPTLQAWWNRTEPPSTRFLFERNPYYHRVDPRGNQLPYIDRVVINIVSKDVIPAKSGTGEADLQARYLRFDHIPFLKQGEENGNYTTYLWSLGRGSQVALFPNLNAADPVWRALNRDVRFRRAISLGINRDEINESLYFGLATPSANTVLPGSSLYKEEYANAWISHDPEQANALLDEIGLGKRDSDGIRLLPDGRRMEITVESAGESTEETDMLELIAGYLKEVGVKVFVRASQRDIFRRRAYSGETVMSVFNGLDNAVPSAEMNPQELAPTAQPQLQWSAWGQYYETQGKAGEEPDLAEAKEQMDLFREWMAAPDLDAKKAAWQKMLANYSDQVFTIGTVNNSRQPVVVANDLRNVPEEAIYAWEPTAYFGAYQTDTFWFEQ